MANDVSGIVTKTEAAPGLARLSLGFERKSLITRLHVLLLSAKPWGNWTTHSTPTLAPDPLSPSLSLSLSISLSLAHKHARMLALSLTSRLSLTHSLSLPTFPSRPSLPGDFRRETNEDESKDGFFRRKRESKSTAPRNHTVFFFRMRPIVSVFGYDRGAGKRNLSSVEGLRKRETGRISSPRANSTLTDATCSVRIVGGRMAAVTRNGRTLPSRRPVGVDF